MTEAWVIQRNVIPISDRWTGKGYAIMFQDGTA